MSRKGFTLIELLVVVAVLALLASIVFSNLGGAREGARISNALSFQSQMHNLLGSDLVAWWSLDDGTGSVFNDISGYGNNGTIQGSLEWVAGVSGTDGYALQFDGESGYGTIPTSPIHNFADKDTTIVAWFQSNASGRLLGKRSGGTPGLGYDFNASPDTIYFSHRTGVDFPHLNMSATVGNDKWNHVAVTIRSAQNDAGMYLNGNLEVTDSGFGDLIDYNVSLALGARRNQANIFDGKIDDVRIYSRALTTQEIQGIYAQTKDKYLAND